jgi:hypothetical protein
LVAETMLWLPENNKTNWIDMLQIFQLGDQSDPQIDNRIELHDPDGKVWLARRFGSEVIFGKTVEKGIAARMLQYANELLAQGYQTTPVDFDSDGTPDWYIADRHPDGTPIVLFDPGMVYLNAGGNQGPPPPNCNQTDNSGCICEDNRSCSRLKQYMTVPRYLWQALRDFGYDDPDQKGIWD